MSTQHHNGDPAFPIGWNVVAKLWKDINEVVSKFIQLFAILFPHVTDSNLYLQW